MAFSIDKENGNLRGEAFRPDRVVFEVKLTRAFCHVNNKKMQHDCFDTNLE